MNIQYTYANIANDDVNAVTLLSYIPIAPDAFSYYNIGVHTKRTKFTPAPAGAMAASVPTRFAARSPNSNRMKRRVFAALSAATGEQLPRARQRSRCRRTAYAFPAERRWHETRVALHGRARDRAFMLDFADT